MLIVSSLNNFILVLCALRCSGCTLEYHEFNFGRYCVKSIVFFQFNGGGGGTAMDTMLMYAPGVQKKS